MTVQRSFPFSGVSILSIVLYCVGFIRVELELNEHTTRIDALENVVETKPPTNCPNVLKIINNTPGKFVSLPVN